MELVFLVYCCGPLSTVCKQVFFYRTRRYTGSTSVTTRMRRSRCAMLRSVLSDLSLREDVHQAVHGSFGFRTVLPKIYEQN